GLQVARLKGLDDHPVVALQAGLPGRPVGHQVALVLAITNCPGELPPLPVGADLHAVPLVVNAVGPRAVAHGPDRLEAGTLKGTPNGPVADRPDADLLGLQATQPERPPG